MYIGKATKAKVQVLMVRSVITALAQANKNTGELSVSGVL